MKRARVAGDQDNQMPVDEIETDLRQDAVTLRKPKLIPLDAEHRRLALVYLTELLAPLFGPDSSA